MLVLVSGSGRALHAALAVRGILASISVMSGLGSVAQVRTQTGTREPEAEEDSATMHYIRVRRQQDDAH